MEEEYIARKNTASGADSISSKNSPPLWNPKGRYYVLKNHPQVNVLGTKVRWHTPRRIELAAGYLARTILRMRELLDSEDDVITILGKAGNYWLVRQQCHGSGG